jgi:hypothetical protein
VPLSTEELVCSPSPVCSQDTLRRSLSSTCSAGILEIELTAAHSRSLECVVDVEECDNATEWPEIRNSRSKIRNVYMSRAASSSIRSVCSIQKKVKMRVCVKMVW